MRKREAAEEEEQEEEEEDEESEMHWKLRDRYFFVDLNQVF